MPDSITSTNLAVAISNTSDRVISVITATGFSVGRVCYVDREAMSITGVNGTLISVRRGACSTRSTPHTAGSRIFVAPPQYFTSYDRQGAGVYADQQVQPYINVATGKIWSVVGTRWVEGSLYGSSATSYGLSEAIWSDCPLDKMLVDPGYGTVDGDDFTSASGSPLVTAHKYTQTETGATMALVASVIGGAVLISTAAGDKEGSSLIVTGGAHVKADAVTTWWYETRLKIGQIATAQGQFAGLSSECGNDFMVDDDNTIKVVDWLGFQVLRTTDGAAIWITAHSLTGGARAALNSTLQTCAADTYVKLGMKSVAGTVTFYLNGVADATTVLSSAANFPLNKYLFPVFASKNGSGVVSTMTIDWWKVASTRLAN